MAQLKITLVAAIAVLAGIALRQPAAADSPVPCSGDDSACQLLVVEQRGTDPNSGAHIHLKFTNPPGFVKQSMMLTLSIASSSDSCDSATDTFANLNSDDPRDIDGYLCQLRATWERR